MATAAGVAYYHYQGQEMLRVAVERRLGALYGNLSVSVRAARFVGEEGVEIRGVQIAERTLAGPAADLVYVDEIFLTCSTRIADLLAGEFDVSSVVLRRMRFRATRMPDGTWSSAALLPLPDRGGDTPTIAVEDGTIEIVEPRKGTAAQTLTLRDLQLTVSKQPAPAADEGNPEPQPQLRVEGTLAGDHFKQLEFEALISDHAAARWSARGKLLGLRVSRELNAVLPREIARHLTQLDAVQGRADLGFALASGASQDSPLQFAVSGELTEAQVQLPGLAQPLSDVQAGFRCDNRECRVENLVARFGEAKLLLSATRFGLADDSPLTLTAAARNLQLDNQLPAALPEMLQPVWQKFSPAGVVDADLQLNFDGQPMDPGPDRPLPRCVALLRTVSLSALPRHRNGAPGG